MKLRTAVVICAAALALAATPASAEDHPYVGQWRTFHFTATPNRQQLVAYHVWGDTIEDRYFINGHEVEPGAPKNLCCRYFTRRRVRFLFEPISADGGPIFLRVKTVHGRTRAQITFKFRAYYANGGF